MKPARILVCDGCHCTDGRFLGYTEGEGHLCGGTWRNAEPDDDADVIGGAVEEEVQQQNGRTH